MTTTTIGDSSGSQMTTTTTGDSSSSDGGGDGGGSGDGGSGGGDHGPLFFDPALRSPLPTNLTSAVVLSNLVITETVGDVSECRPPLGTGGGQVRGWTWRNG